MNFSDSLFGSNQQLSDENSFQALREFNLSQDSESDLQSQVRRSGSTGGSKPAGKSLGGRKNQPSTKKSRSKCKLDHKLKCISLNARSLKGKVPEFHAIIKEHQPDIICVTETHIDDSISSSELFPSNFNVYRKDRNCSGGGVAIAVKNSLASLPRPDLDTETEIIWTQILLTSGKTFLVGCY